MPAVPTSEFLHLQQALAGRYSIERELGRGGMGIVFLARDVALDRPVAIKLLPPALAIQPELRERFLREARTAAKLSHPNIVPIHLVEERGDLVYFVMALVDGETLGQRVRRAGPLLPSQASRVVQEVAWALAYAHSRGIVHRDVKPDNILLDKDSGRAMVTDFGIARVTEAGTMTGAGEIVGTAHYMSPEQASGDAVDGRSDLFSLGVTAYYSLTGTLPFDGPNLPAIVARIVTEDAPRLAAQRPDVPTSLAMAVDRCLAKKPAGRFASGEELAEAVGATPTAEAPPQIRVLLRTARELDSALGFLTLAAFVGPSVVRAIWQTGRPVAVYMLAAAVVGPIVMVPLNAFLAARKAIKAGLGPVDVRRALERASRAVQEEAALWAETADRPANRRKHWMRLGHVGVLAGLGTAAIGAVTGAIESTGAVRGFAVLSLTLGLLGYTTAFLLRIQERLAKKKRSRVGWLGIGERLLGTRVCDWLFKLAGIGLDVRAQNAPPAEQRTEVLIALAAGDLFDRLSPVQKIQFGEVPAIVRRLEAEADRLRGRGAALARAVVEANPQGGPGGSARRAETVAELQAARAAAGERLSTVVAALENIRLDLLRLQAGIGSAADLTGDIEKARAIGIAVDAEIHGRREVEKILSRT